MSLNDTNDHVRNQVLVLDPLTSVNKELRVEKERDIHVSLNSIDNSAMIV